jgi:hypothetical protein
MNTAIETELKNLLDNVNKTLALKMSEKHGLDYDEVYEFLTTSMNEDKAPASRGRPKKEKKTITENQKDTTGKPDVNHIIKEIMEKDAELEELTEDEIDEDVVEVAKEASPASPLPNDDKDKEGNDKPKEDDKKPKEKAKRKPAAAASAEEKAKAAEEKAKAAEEKAKEKVKAAEEKKAEAEKLKAQKAAEKAAEKEAAKAEKKTRGKSGKKKEEKQEENVEVVAEVKEAAAEAAASEEDEEGEHASEIEFNGKIYLKKEFGTTIFDAVTHEVIGEWDEKNQKIIFNV